MKRLILLLLAILMTAVSHNTEAAAGITGGGPTAAAGQTTALEIVCTGLKDGDRAVYDVYGPDGKKIYSVALQGDDPGRSVSRRIIGLEPGLYRVEVTSWNWSYDNSPALLELSAAPGETAVFNFTAKKRSALMRHYEDGKLNRFKHL